MNNVQLPDITPMQKIVGAVTVVLTALLGVVNAFGWYDISGDQAGAILTLWAALGGLGVIADSIIRNGRSKIAAAAIRAGEKPPGASANP